MKKPAECGLSCNWLRQIAAMILCFYLPKQKILASDDAGILKNQKSELRSQNAEYKHSNF
jgi:hypothetical protein